MFQPYLYFNFLHSGVDSTPYSNQNGTVTNMAKSSDWRKPKGAVRVPGICRDAEALGVSRQHLRLVLTGKRVGSQRLLSAYAARRQQTKRSK